MTIDEFLIYSNRKHESIFYVPHSRSDKRAYRPKPKENRFSTAKQISFNDFFSSIPLPSLAALKFQFIWRSFFFIVFKHKSHLYEVPIFFTSRDINIFWVMQHVQEVSVKLPSLIFESISWLLKYYIKKHYALL